MARWLYEHPKSLDSDTNCGMMSTKHVKHYHDTLRHSEVTPAELGQMWQDIEYEVARTATIGER